MICNFRIGQKVVSVGCEGSPRPKGFWEKWVKDWNVTLPQRGIVYTVRDIRVSAGGVGFIRVDEIRNPVVEFIDSDPQEPWFFAAAFRPVATPKTDISIFTDMLITSKQGVDA